jgi:serine/threonine protein kinase
MCCSQPFPEETLWNYLIQMAVGLKHLHTHRVLHRDIKTQNVFLDANGNLKIGDLGLARIMGSQSLYAYSGKLFWFFIYVLCVYGSIENFAKKKKVPKAASAENAFSAISAKVAIGAIFCKFSEIY